MQQTCPLFEDRFVIILDLRIQSFAVKMIRLLQTNQPDSVRQSKDRYTNYRIEDIITAVNSSHSSSKR
jgi:hypothetical protein